MHRRQEALRIELSIHNQISMEGNLMNTPDKSRDSEQGQGTGPEGTIPDTEDGVGATSTEEPSNFEPEEDKPKDDDGDARNTR